MSFTVEAVANLLYAATRAELYLQGKRSGRMMEESDVVALLKDAIKEFPDFPSVYERANRAVRLETVHEERRKADIKSNKAMKL